MKRTFKGDVKKIKKVLLVIGGMMRKGFEAFAEALLGGGSTFRR